MKQDKDKTPVNRELPTPLVEKIRAIALIEDRSFTAVYTRLLTAGISNYLDEHPDLRSKLQE